MPRGLSIHGRLAVTLEGHRIVIDAAGDHVAIEVPSRGALWTLIQYRPQRKSQKAEGEKRKAGGSGDGDSQPGAARGIADLLERGNLTISVRLSGKTVARAGVGAQPTWLSKLMGLGPIEVHPSSAILALWKGKA